MVNTFFRSLSEISDNPFFCLSKLFIEKNQSTIIYTTHHFLFRSFLYKWPIIIYYYAFFITLTDIKLKKTPTIIILTRRTIVSVRKKENTASIFISFICLELIETNLKLCKSFPMTIIVLSLFKQGNLEDA